MIVGWAAVAHGQVANGDFGSGDLASWAAGGAGGTVVVVTEGSSFSVGPYTDSQGILFPSAPYAARLTAGGQGTLATLAQTIEITRPGLRIDHRAESEWLDVHLLVRPTVGSAVADVRLTPSSAGFDTAELDLADLCGGTARVEIQVASLPDDGGAWSAWYLLLDDIRLEGDVCPQYLDLDGDGWCLGGVDLDADGECAASAEAASYERDCDDADAALSPSGVEVAGDGLDQDCDAIDLCFLDADLDGYGGPVTTPGDDVICGNVAGEAASATDCDDADGDVYPGAHDLPGDGVDRDCDGTAETEPEPEPEPETEPEPIAETPADTPEKGGCTHTVAPPWLALLALAAARRPVKRSGTPEAR